MEFLFGLVAGLVWWEMIALFVISVICGISLFKESALGFGVATALVSLVDWTGTGSLWSNVSIGGIITYLVIYVSIGIGWSVFKWRKTVIKKIAYFRDSSRDYTNEEIKERIKDSKDFDTISFWILAFPFSVFGYLFNDLIIDLVKKLSKLFDTITDRLVDKELSK